MTIRPPLAAAALALALLAAGAAPAAAAKPKDEAAKAPKLTPAVQNALAAAQKAQAAGDIPGAVAKLREAEAVANRSANDNNTIAQVKIQVGQAGKDNALTKEGLEGSLASGLATPEQQTTFKKVLGDMAVNTKDYATALKYYREVARDKPNDPELAGNIAKLSYDNRALSPTERMAALKAATDVYDRAGQKPEEFFFQAQVQIASDAKLPADEAVMAYVRAYPSAKSWETATYIFRQNRKLDNDTDIDVYRLQRATGSLTGGAQYLDYGLIAQQRGLPGEVDLALKEGMRKGVIQAGSANYADLSKAATPARIAADKASLPKLETQARASATGKLAAATADAHLGYGNYTKAADLYRLALTKGGVTADTVNTRLGYALAMSGDKAGATAAFAAVQGEPRATLAKYWQVWVGQKG